MNIIFFILFFEKRLLDPNKPVFHARCNEGDCPPEWKEGPWSPVSIFNNLLLIEMTRYNFFIYF